MKFGVITFPGSNCDEDMVYVLESLFNQKVERLWHKDADLKGVDFVILPGGFSYGDYLRSGAICNGFQILCESKLLPGTLLHNNNQKFICKNIYLRADNNSSIINAHVDTNQALKIPIAHGEGRYFASDETIAELNANDQIIFRYCDADGNITKEANPNGSLENIAGVCNAGKNVFGMMPHPERAADAELGNVDGALLFESILGLIKA